MNTVTPPDRVGAEPAAATPAAAPAGFFSRPPHEGLPYTQVLGLLHRELRPKSYLEIGTQFGDTLAIAECASISVDVNFQVSRNVIGKKPWCGLYQMPSDEFFATQDPTRLFGRPVDLAFLDGMHYFEFLLRDFINTEKHCRPNSVVVLHDCVPPDTYVARRELSDQTLAGATAHRGWWAGDVWKTVDILRRVRPDLEMHVFDCPPTGLVLITNLDPASTVLSERYFELVKEHANIWFDRDQAGRYLADLVIEDSKRLQSSSEILKLFWL